jgi:hypothetical protein
MRHAGAETESEASGIVFLDEARHEGLYRQKGGETGQALQAIVN